MSEQYLDERLAYVGQEIALFSVATRRQPTPSHEASWAALVNYREWLRKLRERIAEGKVSNHEP